MIHLETGVLSCVLSSSLLLYLDSHLLISLIPQAYLIGYKNVLITLTCR